MPLNIFCNNNFHDLGWLHIVCSCTSVKYENKDKLLFSFVVPTHLSYSYSWIFHPKTGVAPWPVKIVQDVHTAIRAIEVIMEANGCYLLVLAVSNIPSGLYVQTKEKTTSNLSGPMGDVGPQSHLDKKGIHINPKSLLDDPKRNIMNMFALQDYFDADEDL